jgi:RNA polymerase subunit RPABC4/transcription elongation factor Spt4
VVATLPRVLPTPEPTPPKGDPLTETSCSRCGAPTAPDANFCPNCGLAYASAETQLVAIPSADIQTSKTSQAKVAAGRGLRAYDGALKSRWPRGRWVVHGLTALILVSLAASATSSPDPSDAAAVDASTAPSALAVVAATPDPTATPTPVPTAEITPAPTATPTAEPTAAPTPEPTAAPTPKPSKAPTFAALKKAAEKPKYKTLFRYSENYEFESVYYKGEVIQVLDDGAGTYTLRINVTKGEYGWYEDTVLVIYEGKRVIEDDIVEFVATYTGPHTYESVMGGDITIPAFILGDAKLRILS